MRVQSAMRVLLTGGSGDLGDAVAERLALRGEHAVRLDPRPPRTAFGEYAPGSILDRHALRQALSGSDFVVHIAAWHGIHERQKSKSVDDFWNLNVAGTYEVFEAGAQQGISRVVFISSTSVSKPASIYGHSKILGEQIAAGYALRHGMNIVILRPRAFIPASNKELYPTLADWCRAFARGGVHVDDVADAVLLALARTAGERLETPLTCTLDGAYEYSPADLSAWDHAGPGTTFCKYFPEYVALATAHQFDLAYRPRVLPRELAEEAARDLGYAPRFGLRQALELLSLESNPGAIPK